MEPMHTVWQHKATALPFLWCLRLVVVHNKKTALDYHTNPGQLDTGQLGTGHLDTGQLGTGQLGTHESGKVGQLDTSI